ncbi:MAG: vitamin K epoxide reductase family protein [Terriglobia bacterium]
MSAILLLGLAALGVAISFYFTLAYYGRVESPSVPAALCRREERSCVTILATPYARLLGVPNALVGIAFYLLTGIVSTLALFEALPHWLWLANLVAAAGTVLLAPYLVWALGARLKTWCGL